MSELTAVREAEMGLELRAAILGMREVDTPPAWICGQCRDTGMVISGDSLTGQTARVCGCGLERAAERRLAKAGIPKRYEGATLETFRTAGMDPSAGMALRMARGLVAEYPMGERGLLLHGTCGVGKTHLSISILRNLVVTRGASGRWWDLGDLLAAMKRSYGGSSLAEGLPSEGALLAEVSAVDVLVLDELGAQRLTDWSMETTALLLNARYNNGRLTVLTTNYPNLPAGAGVKGSETLGDRLGTRIWSRLQEMTRVVEMAGADFRLRKDNRA